MSGWVVYILLIAGYLLLQAMRASAKKQEQARAKNINPPQNPEPNVFHESTSQTAPKAPKAPKPPRTLEQTLMDLLNPGQDQDPEQEQEQEPDPRPVVRDYDHSTPHRRNYDEISTPQREISGSYTLASPEAEVRKVKSYDDAYGQNVAGKDGRTGKIPLPEKTPLEKKKKFILPKGKELSRLFVLREIFDRKY